MLFVMCTEATGYQSSNTSKKIKIETKIQCCHDIIPCRMYGTHLGVINSCTSNRFSPKVDYNYGKFICRIAEYHTNVPLIVVPRLRLSVRFFHQVLYDNRWKMIFQTRMFENICFRPLFRTEAQYEILLFQMFPNLFFRCFIHLDIIHFTTFDENSHSWTQQGVIALSISGNTKNRAHDCFSPHCLNRIDLWEDKQLFSGKKVKLSWIGGYHSDCFLRQKKTNQNTTKKQLVQIISVSYGGYHKYWLLQFNSAH